MTKHSLVLLAAMASASAAFAQFQGPSSSSTAYVVPVASGWSTTSVLSAGDSIGGYTMVGIPDGLGAYDNGNGTFTVLMNHELGNNLGTTRAHGAVGAFVSEWVINKSDFSVVSGRDLIQSVYNWNTTTQQSNATTSTVTFNRFCSADLAPTTAFYNASTGNGTQARIFLNGEEGGSTQGYAIANIATGTSKGSSFVLGGFNLATNGSGTNAVGGWENLLAHPNQGNVLGDKTVVIGNNDGGTGIMTNSVGVYVGTKTSAGTDADKAGLTNGAIKFVNVTGVTAEIANTTNRATNIADGARFSLSANSSTTFSRPEDGAWNPNNANEYFFVTTDRLDTVQDGAGSQVGATRLWKLSFDDISNPDAGGTISKVLEGGTASANYNMFDNMTITADGKIMLQEDVGNAAHNGKIWMYDPVTGQTSMVAMHDQARFGNIGVSATSPFNQDEETSGIIDVTGILGRGDGFRYFLSSDQAHYLTGNSTTVEGGQLFVLTAIPEPSSAAALAGFGALGLAALRRRRRA